MIAVERLALDQLDVADPRLYQEDAWRPYFARLRREAPVHHCPRSAYGPYWSVTSSAATTPRATR